MGRAIENIQFSIVLPYRYGKIDFDFDFFYGQPLRADGCRVGRRAGFGNKAPNGVPKAKDLEGFALGI